MNWVFVVARNNSVEQVKVFKDFWEGANFADNFIKRIEPGVGNLPEYNRGEYYKNDDLTIGLYPEHKLLS
jgi:hypothetical protein